MSTIIDILGRQILDSRGNPTVEVDVVLDDGSIGTAAAFLEAFMPFLMARVPLGLLTLVPVITGIPLNSLICSIRFDGYRSVDDGNTRRPSEAVEDSLASSRQRSAVGPERRGFAHALR